MGAMQDRYRLVFRGEMLEGQHAAVVKKRLGVALKLDDARVATLFGGGPVVIKRDADSATAARFQALFKKAGARLRVVPVEGQAERKAEVPRADLSLRAVGTDLVDAEERPAQQSVRVGVDHLSLAAPGATLGVQRPIERVVAPDTSRFTLAAPGADLRDVARPAEIVEKSVDPDWEIAEPGVTLGVERSVVPTVDIERIEFDVAPAGADLGQVKRPPPPHAPDTSHLELA